MSGVPYSRAAWESWEDIYNAVEANLMEPPPLMWGCPNNPYVVIVNRKPDRRSV